MTAHTWEAGARDREKAQAVAARLLARAVSVLLETQQFELAGSVTDAGIEVAQARMDSRQKK